MKLTDCKYHYRTFWRVRVDGRVYEDSKTEERRDEIVPILKQLYPDSEVTVERKRERVYERGVLR